MTHEFKNLVLMFLQNIPQDVYEAYNKAFEFYKQLSGRSRQMELHYNRGYTEAKLKALLYDIQKLAEITDLEIAEPPKTEAEQYQIMANQIKKAFNRMDATLKNQILIWVKFLMPYADHVDGKFVNPVLQEFNSLGHDAFLSFKESHPKLRMPDGLLAPLDLADLFAEEIEALEIPALILAEMNTVGTITLNPVMEEFRKYFDSLIDIDQEPVIELFAFVDTYGEKSILENEELANYFANASEVLEKMKEANPDFIIAEGKLVLEDMVVFAREQVQNGPFLFKQELADLIVKFNLTLQSTDNEDIVPVIPINNIEADKSFEPIKTGAFTTIANIVGENAAEEVGVLRDEFPFLNNADCPEIMYVVVGRRIRAHKLYVQLHAELAEINTGTKTVTAEEKTKIALDCQAAFDDNRKLWDELNHYNLNGEILGKHMMFREDNIKKEVELMTEDQRGKFKAASAKYFHDQKAKLEKYKDNPKKIAEVHQLIEDRNYKLALVNAKIGVSDAGAKAK